MSEALCIVNATAPVRICDIGGWTDTWFAEHGDVVNLAVAPYVRVQIFAREQAEGLPRITVFAENYNDRFQVLGDELASGPGQQFWIEALNDILAKGEQVF